MPKLPELLDALVNMDDKPDSMFDDIRSAYELDIAEKDSAIADLENSIVDADANSAAAVAERDATIADLKAKNYDLIRSIPASSNAGGGTGDDEVVSGESDDVENPEQVTIDDLFTERD